MNIKNLGKPLLWGNSCVSTQEVLPTCSFAKSFNPNLEADSHNQSSITKPFNDTVTSAPLSHKALAMLNVRLLIGRKYTKAISSEKLTVSNHSNNLEVSLQRSHLRILSVERSSVAAQLLATPGSTHKRETCPSQRWDSSPQDICLDIPSRNSYKREEGSQMSWLWEMFHSGLPPVAA